MSVKLKITVIVLLGVAFCIGIALLSNVFVAKSEKAGELRATIEQALVQAVSVRLAERQFLESASEENWQQIQKRLEATQAKLTAAQAMSDEWTAPIEELQSLLQDYKSDVKQLRTIVLAINSGLADFAAKSQMLSTVLHDNVVQPVNEAEASAALFNEKVSTTLLSLKPYALALGEQLSAERLITQELFLFNNRQDYEAQKEKLEKLFKVRKKNLFSTLNMLGEQHDMLAAKNAIDIHLQQFFTLQEKLTGLHASLMELSKTFEALGNKLLNHSRKLVTAMQQAYQQQRLQNQQLSWAVVGLVALLLAGLGLFIGRSITKPLTALRSFASKVAAGDLDARPEGSFRAEMAQLQGDIQAMVAGLKDIMDKVEHTAQQAKEEEERACTAMLEAQQAKSHAETARKEGMLQAAERLSSIVQNLSSATEQLFGQVEQFNTAAQQQSEQAERTSTVMSQMNSSVLDVARNAGTTAQSAEETREHAAKGSNIVDQSIEAIGRVHQEAQELKTKMLALDEQAASIGSVMNVINDIADQTNLLALNAAIEAARAGEAGRGFAVVADEVRKLAEKTMGATREVGNAIAAIQDGARKGVASMDAAGQAVETATQLAQNSGQALTRIVDLVRETSDQISSIASAAEEQSSASEEISATVDEISSNAGSTRDAANDALTALEEVKGLTNDLVELIQELQQEMA